MFDTVNFRLLQDEAGQVEFLSETPQYLENVVEHTFAHGETVITGNLSGLSVWLSRYQMKIKDGSLCKWYLGDNYQTLGRGDTQRAIEKLSDTLHLPISKATVIRMDLAQNFIVQHPPEVYFNHLGILRYATRLQEPNGIYYKQAGGRLAFYDKNKEQKQKRQTIPELYRGRNVLRYEQRYIRRIAAQLKSEVTGAMLFDEAFYIGLLKRWKDTYKAIEKINDSDITLNFEAVKTKKQLYQRGVLLQIKEAGGLIPMLEKIKEAQKRGELTKKEAFDLRQAINEAAQMNGLTTPNEAIKELNKKVRDSVRFYR